MTNEVEILLVEDSEDDIELTVTALRKENLANSIHVSRDGQEALDFLFGGKEKIGGAMNNHPRVVLLDLKLPRVDGLEVLRVLKSDPRTKCIPVVILTSSKEERDVLDGYRLGVNSFIQKPVDFSQFRDTVRQLGLYWMIVNEPPPPAPM